MSTQEVRTGRLPCTGGAELLFPPLAVCSTILLLLVEITELLCHCELVEYSGRNAVSYHWEP